MMAAMPAEAGTLEIPGSARVPECRAVSLHFVLAPEDAGHFSERLDRLSGASAATEKVRSIYLDTPDHAITALGLGFGVRQRREAVSLAAEARSVTNRSAWKRIVEPLSAATAKGAKRKLKFCLRSASAIEVVARVETQRHLWSVACGESQAKVGLDRSTVLMNGGEVTLASVRFACAAPNADFFRLVTDACEVGGLRLSAESDLARAYRLCDSPNATHVTAFTPDLNTDMDAAAAFRTIATACFDHFLLNETAIRTTGDREAVHQCRVALRRLSACLRLFSGFVSGADYEALRADLKELGTYLRNARDLDVMIADVITPAIAIDPPSGAPALMREIEARRQKAHADLIAQLCAPSSAVLFLRFALWLEAGDWTKSADPKSVKQRRGPVVKYVRKKFEKMNSNFGKRCAELGQADAEARHGTRIRAKNLRYDTEFFATLARDKSASARMLAFLQAVKTLQTVLGDWNDILMARRFLTSFGQAAKVALTVDTKNDLSPELVAGTKRAGALKGRKTLIAAAQALAERFKETSQMAFDEKCAKACRALGKVKPFWAKLG